MCENSKGKKQCLPKSVTVWYWKNGINMYNWVIIFGVLLCNVIFSETKEGIQLRELIRNLINLSLDSWLQTLTETSLTNLIAFPPPCVCAGNLLRNETWSRFDVLHNFIREGVVIGGSATTSLDQFIILV